MHFSEKIEIIFAEKMPYLDMYFKAFLELRLLHYKYLWKRRAYPQFSFMIAIALASPCQNVL